MQAGAAWYKADLGVILAIDHAHVLGHHVAVVPRRAEAVLHDHPARREDDKVSNSGARRLGGTGEDGVNGGILRESKGKGERGEAIANARTTPKQPSQSTNNPGSGATKCVAVIACSTYRVIESVSSTHAHTMVSYSKRQPCGVWVL